MNTKSPKPQATITDEVPAANRDGYLLALRKNTIHEFEIELINGCLESSIAHGSEADSLSRHENPAKVASATALPVFTSWFTEDSDADSVRHHLDFVKQESSISFDEDTTHYHLDFYEEQVPQGVIFNITFQRCGALNYRVKPVSKKRRQRDAKKVTA